MTEPNPVDGLRPGMRAVVRHRIAGGLTDALGDVVAMDDDTISVQTRRGLVVVSRAAVVVAKEVPPRATRRGAPHLALSMDDLEKIMVAGWQPVEQEELGDWLLRAANGFTGRANSVLPLGSPGVPLSEAVDRSERWYDERGLRRMFSLFGPQGFAVQDDPLGQELVRRRYEAFSRTLVLTGATATLPSEIAHPSGASVRLEKAPSPRWWDAWADRDSRDTRDTRRVGTSRVATSRGDPAPSADSPDSAARAVMTGSPEQLFASLEVDGTVIGVARMALAQAWAGVSAVQVTPDQRRAGVAMQLMGALSDACRARGIRSMYLQVTQENSAARSLYERLGFSVHHEYVYLGG